jgi:hypothetical protein
LAPTVAKYDTDIEQKKVKVTFIGKLSTPSFHFSQQIENATFCMKKHTDAF